MISYVELDPPISLTKTTTTWETFDLSASIPAGATFAVVRIENTTSTGRRFGYRAVGDTAPQTTSISGALAAGSRYYYIPLSASRQLEIDISSTSVIIQVLAYLNENATKVNYANITIPTANVWQTVDMSAYVTSTEAPKAAILLLNAVGSAVGFSPYGSSTYLFNSTAAQAKQTFVIPLSTDYTFNVFSTTTTANVVNIIGTINKGFIKYVEPIDKTPGSLSTWTPLSAPSNTATAGLYTVLDLGSGTDAYGLRKGGNTTNQTGRLYRIDSAIISANSAGVVEANVTNSNYRVYEMGYFANIESQITSAPVLITDTGTTLNGLELITSNSARIRTGTKSIALDSFSSTDWNISFAVPSITNFISSNVAVGPVTLEVLNSSNAIVLSTPAIVEPPDQYSLHTVTSTASSANIGSIYYGQISPICINDVFLYDSATANYAWNFDITSNGYMIFYSDGSTLSDSVSYRVYSSTSETWNHMQYINLASPYINARTNSSRVAKSVDGNRYSKYPNGNAP